jgi:hypothetical protein
MNKLYESYQWVVPFELGTQKGKKVIIRGRALNASVSSNQRRYIRQELIESARSLAGKYIDVNHEMSLWEKQTRDFKIGQTGIPPGPKPKLKGNVVDAQYEDGWIEYIAEINHKEYAEKLIDRERMSLEEYVRKWHQQPIRYVSVDATYRFHREKDIGIEPHGIIFNGLSLVEGEQPGIKGTSVEVLEIRESQMLEAQRQIVGHLLAESAATVEEVAPVVAQVTSVADEVDAAKETVKQMQLEHDAQLTDHPSEKYEQQNQFMLETLDRLDKWKAELEPMRAAVAEYAGKYRALQETLNATLDELAQRDLAEIKRLAETQKRLSATEQAKRDNEAYLNNRPAFRAGYTGGDVGLAGGATGGSWDDGQTPEEREKERVRRSSMG